MYPHCTLAWNAIETRPALIGRHELPFHANIMPAISIVDTFINIFWYVRVRGCGKQPEVHAGTLCNADCHIQLKCDCYGSSTDYRSTECRIPFLPLRGCIGFSDRTRSFVWNLNCVHVTFRNKSESNPVARNYNKMPVHEEVKVRKKINMFQFIYRLGALHASYTKPSVNTGGF